MMISRLHWLLLLLCTELLLYSQTTARPYKENHPLALGRVTTQSIQGTKNTNVFQSGPNSTKLQ